MLKLNKKAMCNIAIIAEYNPFHNGHLLQIQQIRQQYGVECTVTVIMSGNYVQRGEGGIFDKYTRAKAAVLCGADLVLELPFPLSVSCGELFACGGVAVAEKLGFCDTLCFGSESYNSQQLYILSRRIFSADYKAKCDEMRRDKRTLSDIAVKELAYNALYTDIPFPKKSNDILALHYVTAIEKSGGHIGIFPIKRTDNFTATSCRKMLRDGLPNIADNIPTMLAPLYADTPYTDMTALDNALMAFLRIGKFEDNIADCSDGILNYLHSKSVKYNTFSELIENSANRIYTKSRLRRVCLYAYFGITEEIIHREPSYTLLLAANENGLSLLHNAKPDIEIITKPSHFSDKVSDMVKLSQAADGIYALCQSKNGDCFVKASPFIMK